MIVPATTAHLSAVRSKLRAGDALELACMGASPVRALWRSYRASVLRRAVIIEGEVAAVWGVAGSPLGGIGEPWLLTTPAIERIPVRFVREGRREVGEMLALYPVLQNYVADNYRQACRFLEVLGFRLGDPFAAGGSLWREFRLER